MIVNVNPQRGELTLAIPGQETADENRNFTAKLTNFRIIFNYQ